MSDVKLKHRNKLALINLFFYSKLYDWRCMQAGWRSWTSPVEACHTLCYFALLSRAVGSMLRCLQWPFSWLFFCPLLLAWKHVQLSHHSVSTAVSLSPRLKTPKGPPGKVARPVSQDLCQKCFSPQVICYSLGSFHYLLQRNSQRGGHRERNEREEKWYLVVGSDRSTFLSIDMRSEWGVLLFWCRDADGVCNSLQIWLIKSSVSMDCLSKIELS